MAWWSGTGSYGQRPGSNVNVVNVEESNGAMTAILLGILIVVLTVAGMYFHKNFKIVRRDKDETAGSPKQTSSDTDKQPMNEKALHSSLINQEEFNRRCLKSGLFDKFGYGASSSGERSAR